MTHASWTAVVCGGVLLIAGCSGGADRSTESADSQSATPAISSRYDQGPRASEGKVDKQLAESGEQLFKDKGCSACHAFGQKISGPDLAGVSMRRTAEWMEMQILHPDRMVKEDPIARELFAQFALQMPNQGLTADEARAVIEFLKHKDHESGESHGEEGGS